MTSVGEIIRTGRTDPAPVSRRERAMTKLYTALVILEDVQRTSGLSDLDIKDIERYRDRLSRIYDKARGIAS